MTLVAPTPRFQIGDTVWTPHAESAEAMLDCPDCFGSRKWKVITPAGTELETECRRCSAGYVDSGLPSLKYRTWTPSAHSHLITGINLDATGSRPIEYQSRISNCSWRSFPEDQVYASEREAMAIAKADAQFKNIAILNSAEVLDKKRVANLGYNDARYDQFKNGLYDSWWGYRHLRDDIVEWREEAKGLSDSDAEAIDDMLLWDGQRDPAPLERLVRACEGHAQAEAPDATIVAALDRLPKFVRSALNSEKAEEFAQ